MQPTDRLRPMFYEEPLLPEHLTFYQNLPGTRQFRWPPENVCMVDGVLKS